MNRREKRNKYIFRCSKYHKTIHSTINRKVRKINRYKKSKLCWI